MNVQGNVYQVNDHRDLMIDKLKAEIAQLTAPPTLVKTSSYQDDMRGVTRYEFTWRDFRHNTMVSQQVEQDVDYQRHVLRYGVEACVRAYAEQELERLTITERRESNDEYTSRRS